MISTFEELKAQRHDRDALVRELELAGAEVKGNNVKCFLHDDAHASASIFVGDDGIPRFWCQVCDKGGDLIDISRMRNGTFMKTTTAKAKTTKTSFSGKSTAPTKMWTPRDRSGESESRPMTLDTVRQWITKKRGPIELEHIYPDEHGTEIMRMFRFVPHDGSKPKDYMPARREGDGYILKQLPKPWPLYQLDKIIGADVVVVCEGEKCCDALADLGIPATTNVHGAEKGKYTDWSPLGGKELIVWGDPDAKGQKHVLQVGGILSRLNPAPQIKVIVPASLGLSGKQDVVDYIDRCRNGDGNDVKPEVLKALGTAKSFEVATATQDTVSINTGKRGGLGGTKSGESAESAELLSRDTKESTTLLALDFTRCLEFPIESMPKILHPLIITGAKSIQCPPDFIGVPLLTALGAAIGRSHVIEVKPGWRESSALWTVIAGFPGSAKSPAHELAMKPLHTIQGKWTEEYLPLKEGYVQELKVHKKSLKKWESSKATLDDPPLAPDKPHMRRIIVSDSTVEKLAEIMVENPRGVALIRDELSGWIGAMNQYKGGKGSDVQFFLSSWNGSFGTVDRKNQDEPIIIPHTYLAVSGTCQPEILIKILGADREQDGFASRILISYPSDFDRKWTRAGIHPEVLHPVNDLFEQLSSLPMDEHDGAPCPNILRFSPEGMDAHEEVMNSHYQQKSKYGLAGPLAAVWAKMEGYIARLSLIIHLARYYTRETSELNVDPESVRMAAGMSDYFKAHAGKIYGQISEKASTSLYERVVDWADRHRKSTLEPRDIIGARIATNREEACAILESMASIGMGQWGKQDCVFSFTSTQQLSNSAVRKIQNG